MKLLQVTIPKKFRDEAKELFDEYSTDVSSSEAEKNDKEIVEFHVTVESDQIDEISEKLKDIKDLKSGDLTINVIKQESQIKKGQKTQGSNSVLSQAEIYSQAQQSSVFNKAEWSLVVLSSVIATYGLIADNIIVVIGAMMVAPILSPFISGALSLNIGDKSMLKKSIKTGILSLMLGILSSTLAALPFPVNWNSSLALVSQPSIITVFLSLLVGAAAALTFVTGMRDEIAGVAVAIALIPPIASAGIGIKLFDSSLITGSLTVVLTNVVSIIASGYTCFYLVGIRPSTYYKKKQAEEIKYVIPLSILILFVLSVPIVFTSIDTYQEYTVEENIQGFGEDFFGDSLLQMNVDGEQAHFYVVGYYNETLFEQNKPENSDIQVTKLQESD